MRHVKPLSSAPSTKNVDEKILKGALNMKKKPPMHVSKSMNSHA